MINYQEIELNTKEDFKKVPNLYFVHLTDMHIGKTVVFFKINNKNVTISKELIKVLNKVTVKYKDIVLITYSVTIECSKILKDKGIDYLVNDDYFWSDESYINRG
ncbi:MAG: hypothetical protein WC121_07470 [Candidatus Kapaibacterium sp.]